MPSPSLNATMPPPTNSPRTSSSQRAPLMRRQSSQSSQTSKYGVQSPSSGGEHQPLRHPVKTTRRTKIVLPRNHSSARDLTKLARQAQNYQVAENGRKTFRQKSHEGDTEIRLPGSLDESRAPPMKRNLTAYQLPHNTSNTKLKKNYSHGHLSRIGSGKNLAALNSTVAKGPPSPGLPKRNKRPKSADMGVVDKSLHEQEVELAQPQQEKKDAPKKVGFAVGSSGDSEDDDAPAMEGSGMQEDEWTDQSASASPYSTRQHTAQNTANNSRRASITFDKPPDKHSEQHVTNGTSAEQLHHAQPQKASDVKPEEDGSPVESDGSVVEDEPPSPHSKPRVKKGGEVDVEQPSQQPPSEPTASQRSPSNAAKEHSNPATRRLLDRNAHNPAPALVSNVSTLDGAHSAHASPAPSIRSSRSNIGDGGADQEQDELVSRFIPSASHPSTGSAGNTTMNTPKMGSFQTPENESTLAAQHRDKPNTGFQIGPVSPGSTVSGSSGAATPSIGRSRTELRMLTEKARAEMEELTANNPVIPAHVFDRRNESLKSYLNIAALGGDGRGGLSSVTGLSMGPDLFQGRFKAVNTELKVVQRFRDPIGESLNRLRKCKGSNFAQLRGQKTSQQKPAAKVPISKSATSLGKQPSKLSTSTSPPKTGSPAKPAMSSGKSSVSFKGTDSRRGKVTFSQTPPETREVERNEDDGGADAIARQLWDSAIN